MEQEASHAAMHVKRARKRLYDPIPDETAPTETAPETDTSFALEIVSKAEEAHQIVVDHAFLSMGTALIPVPVVDLVAITAIQLKMLKQLSELYNVAFRKNWGKSLIGSLIGGFHAGLVTGSVIKFFPGLGILIGMLPIAVAAGALTYAVGRVFIQHFELGGTLLNFDPEKVKAYFAEQYKLGQQVVADLK